MSQDYGSWLVQSFRTVGFVRVPSAVDSSAVFSLSREVDLAIASRTGTRADGRGRIFRADRFYERSPTLQLILRDSVLLDVLKVMLGPNIDLVTNRHNHATRIERNYDGTRFHRDIKHWSRSIITGIIYLAPSNQDNGVTRLIPGSHHWPHVDQPEHGGTWLDEWDSSEWLTAQAVSIGMEPGDALLFDGYLYHATGTNKSGVARPVVTLGFRAHDELSASRTAEEVECISGDSPYHGNAALNDLIAQDGA